MGKKIEGLVKVPSSLANHTEYIYKGVFISRYYLQGTVGRVGVRRGGARYRTSQWVNNFQVTTYNEVKDLQQSHIFGKETLKEAVATIDRILSDGNCEIIKGRIYRNFSQEQLEKLK
jgi:hypothetical protein